MFRVLINGKQKCFEKIEVRDLEGTGYVPSSQLGNTKNYKRLRRGHWIQNGDQFSAHSTRIAAVQHAAAQRAEIGT